VTPAEHADEASRLAVEASAVLRDLRRDALVASFRTLAPKETP
jgi:hypothetical protein